ncbi:MAG: hypothetical protein GXP40_03705 [Chloroflexi bacterium]|nr:hypothetical protein [Chloroflexota bacterium]
MKSFAARLAFVLLSAVALVFFSEKTYWYVQEYDMWELGFFGLWLLTFYSAMVVQIQITSLKPPVLLAVMLFLLRRNRKQEKDSRAGFLGG